mmetsp:Transcript_63186/g.137402  ORF Transcript_63186/g.137402 Transcript_63186/m.137402 type:complete len:221 (+) Transcript_63186:247-909(+)
MGKAIMKCSRPDRQIVRDDLQALRRPINHGLKLAVQSLPGHLCAEARLKLGGLEGLRDSTTTGSLDLSDERLAGLEDAVLYMPIRCLHCLARHCHGMAGMSIDALESLLQPLALLLGSCNGRIDTASEALLLSLSMLSSCLLGCREVPGRLLRLPTHRAADGRAALLQLPNGIPQRTVHVLIATGLHLRLPLLHTKQLLLEVLDETAKACSIGLKLPGHG